MVAEPEDLRAGPIIRTPDQRLRVFISSTLQELASERAAARAAITQLRLVPVLFELGARPHPPRDLYRAYLAQSHVFVGIYWQSYGWVAPDMEISGLEDEYLLAGDHPKLVYIKQPAPERDPALGELLDRIRRDNNTSYRPFGTADELRELVENDLAVMLTERFEAPPAEPAASRTGPTVDALPLAPSALIGRDVEVQAVLALLDRDDVRLVTLTGPGGSGKTRLAVELAQLTRDHRGQPVCFADLTGLRSPDLVLPTIAAALGVRDAGDRSIIDAIGMVLADASRLLVVDNFEHVMPAAAQLAEILAVTHGVKILVTSRQPLHLRWEQEYPLSPLDLPDENEQSGVDAVATAPAVQLFVDRAHRVRPDFSLTDENVAAVAEIARRLDGLPLAIELAAARLRILSPADLLDRLEHRLDALGGSTRDAPDRHRTLREAISWSHDLLTEDERALFRRLGVFAGGAGLDAIETVCSGDGIDATFALDVLGSLVDKSLVVSRSDETTGQMRFHLLETVREYAMEELVAAGEAEATFDRHLEWCAALAQRGWREIWGPRMRVWLDLLDREHDNLRLALDHAAGSGDLLLGLQTAHSLWPMWDIRGHYREGQRRLRTLLALTDDRPSTAKGRSLDALGWLTALLGDFEEAYELMREGSEMVRQTGEPYDIAWSLGEQGNVAFSLGLAPEARALFSESLDIARRPRRHVPHGLGSVRAGVRGLARGRSRHHGDRPARGPGPVSGPLPTVGHRLGPVQPGRAQHHPGRPRRRRTAGHREPRAAVVDPRPPRHRRLPRRARLPGQHARRPALGRPAPWRQRGPPRGERADLAALSPAPARRERRTDRGLTRGGGAGRPVAYRPDDPDREDGGRGLGPARRVTLDATYCGH